MVDAIIDLASTRIKDQFHVKVDWSVPATFEDYLIQINPLRSPNPKDRYVLGDGILNKTGVKFFYGNRGELLKEGLVFCNALGNGEKFVLETDVVVNNQTVNLGDYTHLTDDQLEAALEIDRIELTKVASRISPKVISEDMMRFLHESRYNYLKRKRQLIGLNPTYLINHQVLEKRLQSECEDGTIAQGKSMPLNEFFASRGVEKVDFLCQFVKCGQHIHENIDMTFWKDDKSRETNDHSNGLLRINTLSAHLAGHGLSERGGGSDQRYMTMKEYYDLMMEKQNR